jgi:hypothetical protein
MAALDPYLGSAFALLQGTFYAFAYPGNFRPGRDSNPAPPGSFFNELESM